MVINQNTTFNEFLLNDILRSQFDGAIKIDRKLLDYDIKTTKTRERKEYGARKKTLNKQSSYLCEIRRAGTDIKKYRFNCKEDGISSFPFKCEYYDEYKCIEKSSPKEYMVTEEKTSYISLDYSELLNGLALELSYPDFIGLLGELECDLKSINTVSSYDCSILYNLDWLYDLYFLEAKKGKIADSDYYISKDAARDYFLNKVTTDGTYKNIIEQSSRLALSLILINIANECSTNKWKVQLLGIHETGFDLKFTIKNQTEYNKFISYVRSSIVARVLGRKFCFYPQLTVIERN